MFKEKRMHKISDSECTFCEEEPNIKWKKHDPKRRDVFGQFKCKGISK